MDADVINRFRPIRQTRAAMLADADKFHEVARVWGDVVDEVLFLERDCSGDWKLPNGFDDLTYLLTTCCDDLPANIDPAPIRDCLLYSQQLTGGGGDAAFLNLCDARPKAVDAVNRMIRCVMNGVKQEPPADSKADSPKKLPTSDRVLRAIKALNDHYKRVRQGKADNVPENAILSMHLDRPVESKEVKNLARQLRNYRHLIRNPADS